MLTLREVMEMAPFKNAQIVAGEGGLDNPVRWVHIVDMPDAKYEWSRGGELLLTTGYGLKDQPGRQRALIPLLAKRGLAGLVLSTQHYLDRIPRPMREAGDELDFPIIEVPPETAFIEITEVVFSQIVNRQYALRRRAETIHRTLMDLVLEGGTLQDVAEVLAGILGRSITVENAAFEVLAAAQEGPVDEARERSVRRGRTSPALAKRLLNRGIYDQLLERKQPLHVPAIHELGMTMERIVAPIIVAHQIMGYMWVIAGDRELADLDELALDHAATVAALIMFKEKAVRETEINMRGDFFEQLLSSDSPAPPSLVEQATSLGLHPHWSSQVLVLESSSSSGENHPSLPRRLERWMEGKGYTGLVVPRPGKAVVILQGLEFKEGRQAAELLLKDFIHPAEQLLIGVGRSVDELQDLKESYHQATESVEVAHALGHSSGVHVFEDLGLDYWLHRLPPEYIQDNRYMEAVQQIAQYDQDHDTALLLTLQAYLEAGSVASRAAEILVVHRNTLSYRLQRITALTGVDLEDPTERFNLYGALLLTRLKTGRRKG